MNDPTGPTIAEATLTLTLTDGSQYRVDLHPGGEITFIEEHGTRDDDENALGWLRPPGRPARPAPRWVRLTVAAEYPPGSTKDGVILTKRSTPQTSGGPAFTACRSRTLREEIALTQRRR